MIACLLREQYNLSTIVFHLLSKGFHYIHSGNNKQPMRRITKPVSNHREPSVIVKPHYAGLYLFCFFNTMILLELIFQFQGDYPKYQYGSIQAQHKSLYLEVRLEKLSLYLVDKHANSIYRPTEEYYFGRYLENRRRSARRLNLDAE